jgi:fatty acid desaturase
MCKNVTSEAKKLIELKKGDEWIADLDLAAFQADIKKLGDELEKNQGEEDVRHLNKMILWSNLCGLVGVASMGFSVNLLAIIGLSTFTFSRWTMIAHHVCHGGYDKCHPNKGRFHRFKFAIGSLWKRYCDWFDWMMPEAWNVEHNNRHHYNLSEVEDPDLVEENLSTFRNLPGPKIFRYLNVVGAMLSWKWFYYAPNTYKELKLAKLRREGKPIPKGVNPADAVTFKNFFQSNGTGFYTFWEFFSVVFGPYLVAHFFLLPLPLFFIGEAIGRNDLYFNAVKNLFLAEMLTNVHGFIAVVTNHAGDDMYRFREGCRPFSGSFFLRQVIASVDFAYGSDIVDFLQGYLNYQIEHHLWPNLSMRSYQKAAPIVRGICEKHGVPYVKENIFIRLKKTVDIMVGNSSMKWFPEAYEKKFLQMDQLAEKAKNQ